MGYKLGTTGSVEWNGFANARMVTDFGQGAVTFPASSSGKSTSSEDQVEIGKAGFKNTLNADYTGGGNIGISHIVDAGLAVSMKLPSKVTGVGKFPAMSMNSATNVEFIADNATVAGKVCLDVRMGKEQTQSWTSGSYVGWQDTGSSTLEGYSNLVGSPACFDRSDVSNKMRTRAISGATDLFKGLDYISSQGDLTVDRYEWSMLCLSLR